MTPTSAVPAIDRTDVEATLYRVAVSSFTYYPDKEAAEPGYTIDEDVDWCLAPLAGRPAGQRSQLRAMIRVMVTEPTANRREFIAMLADLAEG
ncbi:hypothetical protein LTA6_001875 [Microbacterium sp. LTA6]|uniref:hypothetical protein n=1 Tax=unclassified Microbacterium TaxID=2609290 RepID=UPI00325297DC